MDVSQMLLQLTIQQEKRNAGLTFVSVRKTIAIIFMRRVPLVWTPWDLVTNVQEWTFPQTHGPVAVI
jgi:hypothetical protein